MQHNGAWTRQKPTGLSVGFCAYFEHCFSSATPGGAAFEVMHDFYREAGKSSSWPVTQCFREACVPWLLPGNSSGCPTLPESALVGGPGDGGRSVKIVDRDKCGPRLGTGMVRGPGWTVCHMYGGMPCEGVCLWLRPGRPTTGFAFRGPLTLKRPDHIGGAKCGSC